MKRLSVFLLLLGLVGCNYPSREQALDACYEWKKKGANALYIDPNLDPGNKTTISSRYCNEEKATTQFLGRESNKVAKLIKEGKIKVARDVTHTGRERADTKIVKHFRY